MNIIRKIVEEEDKNILFLQSHFDDALVGTGRACGRETVAVYDSSKCLEILINGFKIDEIEALEQFQKSVDYTTFGSFKPIFINDFRKIKNIPDFDIGENKTLEDVL